MQYYLAPMEGITTAVFRNAYHKYFAPMDQYFTPFLVPHTRKNFTVRECKEIAPERNPGLSLVPQILTNDAEACLQTMEKLEALGYQTVNLNLGCPSKTVVRKYRGAGFLAKPDELDRFLDHIFHRTSLSVSVKTRLGMKDPEEFYRLLEIYNQYPLQELIIHPRVQQEYYQKEPHRDFFAYALSNSQNPVCYNGDVFTVEVASDILQRFPGSHAIMLGRGVIANPGLLGEIKGGQPLSLETFQAFHEEIFQGYQEELSGAKPVLFKMKELWSYWIHLFPPLEKQGKAIQKSKDFSSYEEAVAMLFRKVLAG